MPSIAAHHPVLKRTTIGRSSAVVACLLAAAIGAAVGADVTPHGGMLRYPDIGKTHIVFSYANDLWLVPREGGVASPMASPPGEQVFPRFSPDGSKLAFTANYDGNRDIYVVSVDGGIPHRVTHHPSAETLCGWTPDGELLFYTSGLSGLGRQARLFTVPPTGGMPTALPVPYGTTGAISPDGKWLAYTPHTTDFRTWKRYRGGMATDIWLLNLDDGSSRQATTWEGTDTSPMWHGEILWYLSDDGPEHRQNIWRYDPRSGDRRQVTRFDDFDIKWPSVGPGPDGDGEIVFQHGSALRVLDLRTEGVRDVEVTIPGARPRLRPQVLDAANLITESSISPSGKRVVVSARGDLWTLPAEHGSPRNMTRTAGVFERSPSWSPDGRWLAYLSDETGEYEFWLRRADGRGEPRRLTHDGEVFRFGATWSPDSKHFIFHDKTGAMWLHTLGDLADENAAPGTTVLIDRDPWGSTNLTPSWSHDSRWIAYQRSSDDTSMTHIRLHDVEAGASTQVTTGMFSDSSPAFDRKGDWLYYVSARHWQGPQYADNDTTFIYAGTNVLVAVPLRKDVASPLNAKSDEEPWKELDAPSNDGERENGAADEAEGGSDAEEKAGDAPKGVDDGFSGEWSMRITLGPPLGMAVDGTATLRADSDGAVTGTIRSMMGNAEIVSGRWNIQNRTFSLRIAAPMIGGELNGTVVDGRMTGTLRMDDGTEGTVDGTRTAAAVAEGGDAAATADDKPDPAKRVEIDLEGFEGRAIALPVSPGNFSGLAVNDAGALLFVRRAARGAEGGSSIRIYNFLDDQREERSVMAGGGYELSADGKKILVGRSIANASSNATPKSIVTAGMLVTVEPREEWRQMFIDAWRIMRDWFYDPELHQIDWEAIRDQYLPMVDDCASRDDLTYVIRELISELNVGHAYYNVGTQDPQPNVAVGLLGADFELVDGAYRIVEILRGADWDTDVRSPLDQPGIDVREGDWLLAVNGVPLDVERDPWAALIGAVGRAITLTVSDRPTIDDEAREVIVTPIANEGALRYRAWVERNRRHVADGTDGRVGYIHVPDTGINGQNELFRQFFGQRHLDGLIIDERWNGGGQIPTRFIELLNRPLVNAWARRDGKDWLWPPDAHFGPKCMLINGLAGSGGDAFPHYFREAGLGKLIGTRTWGGLVGISGNPRLIDGTGVNVPTFGFYRPDGRWAIEGHGVDPDLEVIDDPALMLDGGDPQLDAAIKHMLEEIRVNPFVRPTRPRSPDRRGMGLPEDER